MKEQTATSPVFSRDFLLRNSLDHYFDFFFLSMLSDKFGAAMAIVKTDVGGNITVRYK